MTRRRTQPFPSSADIVIAAHRTRRGPSRLDAAPGSAPSTPTVVIAGSEVPSGPGLRATLEGDGFTVLAEVSTAARAVQAVTAHRPDIALLDAGLAGGAIDATRHIGTRARHTAVVILTSSHDDEEFLAALSAGASGYLPRQTSLERLPFALRGVLRGEAALPRELVLRLIDEFRARDALVASQRGPLARLTEREREVLSLMHAGLSTSEMAERLFVAPVTVRTHIWAVLHKLQCTDRRAALRVMDAASAGSAAEPRPPRQR